MEYPKPPSIFVENIWHVNAKNVYNARKIIHSHYNGETYALQIDSHMHLVSGWDVKVIEMLHSCDAGEYSVITGYPANF